jgi:hypothetical protein
MPDEGLPKPGATISEIYKEQYAHFRAMNDILYKIPPLFTAVLGGLWYFAVQSLEKDRLVSGAVFAFSAVASVCFVNIMARFREAFNAYISNLNVMDGDMKVTIKPSPTPSTIRTIQFMLWVACLISVLGIVYAARR